MLLSDYDGIYFKVLRDSRFDSLGLIQKNAPEKSLEYVQSENFLKAACNEPNISAIICSVDLSENAQLLESGKGITVSELPRVAFILFHNYLVRNNREYNPQYAKTQIGLNCKVHPTASIASEGVVIGADNYDSTWAEKGHIVKMQQTGQTYLEDNVEVGCHTVIGRAPFHYQKQ